MGKENHNRPSLEEQFESLISESRYEAHLKSEKMGDLTLREILQKFETPEQKVSLMVLINRQEEPWLNRFYGGIRILPAQVIEGRKLGEHNETVQNVLGDWEATKKLVNVLTRITFTGRLGKIGASGDLSAHEEDPEARYGYN